MPQWKSCSEGSKNVHAHPCISYENSSAFLPWQLWAKLHSARFLTSFATLLCRAVGTGGQGSVREGPGGITPRPYFGRPIPVRGTVYAHHITTSPLLPDFQTFLRPCYAVARPTITMQRKTLTVPKPFCYRILNWIETEFYEIIFQLLIYPIIGVHWNMYLFYICKKQI